MLFNSYNFILIFLPAVLLGAVVTQHFGQKWIKGWIAAASILFYAQWSFDFVYILLASITVNYTLARAALGAPARSGRRDALVLIGVGLNLALLGWFKYAGFLTANLNAVAGTAFDLGAIALPLGISFFTFQKLALLIDIKRDQVRDISLLDYLFFVTFFPQLIAGPIVLFPDIHDRLLRPDGVGVRVDRVAVGLSIFAFGLAKKTFLADKMAGVATPLFNAAQAGRSLAPAEAWSGALAYTFQLYFDFSAYSDMAIGLGWMLGLALPVNFASPYRARSIIDFWHRWHITLSRFLRVYLYIPLGGNRHGPRRRYLNLMIVMLLGGLWHGAAWTFVAWGALHGAFLMVNHLWRAGVARLALPPAKPWQAAMAAVTAWGLTFTAVVVAWVLFRADSFHAALSILSAMASIVPLHGAYPATTMIPDPVQTPIWLLAGLAFVLLVPNTQRIFGPLYPGAAETGSPVAPLPLLAWRPDPVWSIAVAVCLAGGILSLSEPKVFIYFQF